MSGLFDALLADFNSRQQEVTTVPPIEDHGVAVDTAVVIEKHKRVVPYIVSARENEPWLPPVDWEEDPSKRPVIMPAVPKKWW